MLTSTRNSKVKYVRGLQSRSRNREKARAFVIEGVRLTEEALNAGWEAEFVFYVDDLDERGLGVVAGFRQEEVEVIPVSLQVMEAASDTQTPQGILAVLPMDQLPIPEEPEFLVIVDRLRDPGNLGTLLRTALASGVEVVLLPPGNVSPYHPKVVRAGMGAHFRLPIRSCDWSYIQAYVEPLRVYLADIAGTQAHTQTDFTVPMALILGGEAHGAGPEARSLVDEVVTIPLPGEADSLNVAIAGAILLFEAIRQRKRAGSR